jgi:hypothetical protein
MKRIELFQKVSILWINLLVPVRSFLLEI